MSDDVIKTERLILRRWVEADLEPFAHLNADPRVMEWFSAVRGYHETVQEFGRILDGFNAFGWGLWAASLIENGQFIGFIGLSHVPFTADFTPAVEVGWRLAYEYWGKGYATEGAEAALKFGFENLHLDEIVSFTATNNIRSRRVMEKIGMYHDAKHDFDHPMLAEGHGLRRHVLYRIRAGHFTQICESCPHNFKPNVEVAACYLEIGGRVLLMERSVTSAEGKTWGVPAGKLEKGETPYEGARRELFEETGIKMDPSKVQEIGKLYVQKPRGSFIYHLFQVDLDTIPKVVLSHEHTRYVWANGDDIRALDLVGGGKEALEYYRRVKK